MIKDKCNILLWAIFACLTCSSCNDDDNPVIDGDNPDREFMTLFRSERNGISTSDRFISGVSGVNDIQLYWYGVDNCAGYHLKCVIQGRNFDNPYDLIVDTIVGPEVLSIKIEDLQYKTGYRFAIQTLSKRGPEYDSKWFGLGDGAHPDDYLNITTLDRYAVPDVLWVENITYNSLRVSFNLTSDGKYQEHFEEENGKYIMDQIKIEPSSDNPELPGKIIDLTDADKARGYIDVNDLVQNAVYIINGLNNNVKRYWDRLYNTNMVRMKGELGEPILIEHIFDPNDSIPGAIPLNACRIDTVLQNYMSDSNLAEGTTFILEGGKNYYLVNTITMSKGFTLKSNDPNNQPTVYLGVGTNASGEPLSCNFSFGRNAGNGEMGGINVQSICFQDINFDCDKAYNFITKPASAGAGSGNYFINQSSQAMPFALESFEIRNCNFRNMIRGWIRFQGPNRKLVDKFVIDNCIFYDCGVYDNNGRGYSWVAGDGGNANTNLFRNFSLTNCTFIDSPRHALLSENGNLAWPSSTVWYIRMENNTFINFSTRSADRLIFEMRYIPSNSTIICKKNLFVMTRAGNDDSRTLYQAGMDIRQFTGLTFDFDDNYSTLRPNVSSHKIDELFTSYAFSATNRGAGYGNGSLNVGGFEATKIKIGNDGGLEATDLFVDPNPLGKNGEANMHQHNLNGLYFKNTDKVRNHEIYKLGIGDPRWAVNVTP
jgi:hypothetical protein